MTTFEQGRGLPPGVEDWKAPKAAVPETQTGKGPKSADLLAEGYKLVIDTKESEDHTVRAEHQFAEKNGKMLPLKGRAENTRINLREDYKYEYLKLPDGRAVGSEINSIFTDKEGKSERRKLKRGYDEKGRVVSDMMLVEGVPQRQMRQEYNLDGGKGQVFFADKFDQEGNPTNESRTPMMFGVLNVGRSVLGDGTGSEGGRGF